MVIETAVAGAGLARFEEPSFETKLRFLQSAAAYPESNRPPECIETHMSWVFLNGSRVLKLKKPVRYPFLDFSTIERREHYCREELRLNARLAPGVYIGLLALQSTTSGLMLAPEAGRCAAATTVDWLVLMRRLPEQRMLQRLLIDAAVEPRQIDALVAVLGAFYRAAPTLRLDARAYLARLQREQSASREVLLRPQFDLRDAALALDRFDHVLSQRSALLAERAEGGRLVDGHGDLRPEHVCLLQPPVVIDCLEFNEQLRQVDPFDEIAFLAMECALAGAAWIGPRLVAGVAAAIGETPPPGLLALYTAHRALLRARLSMAHLLDPIVRTPQRWPLQAQRYIDHALRSLDGLANEPG